MGRDDQLRKELKNCQTRDPVLSKVLKRSWEILGESKQVKRLEEPDLYIIDFRAASPLLCASDYFTPASQALLIKNTIIINQDFLLEMEAALRSFELAGSLLDSPYLRGDQEIYGLVERIRHFRDRYLSYLRNFWVRDENFNEGDVLEALIAFVLFIVSHEVGHLLDKVNQRGFGTFLQPDAPLEDKIANAVIKLCRHVDEFERLGFSLSGFEGIAQLRSDVRKTELKLRKENESLYEKHTKYFKDEDSADKIAAEIILEYLNRIGGKDEIAAERQQLHLFKAIFVAAICSWYKDLMTFSEKLGVQAPITPQTLSLEMMKNREQYIRAASLFGDVHRFTLLRAFLATDLWLEKRSSYFRTDSAQRSIWHKTLTRKADMTPEERKGWWLSECLQRHMLLRGLMDTAVKFAYIGGATAWLKEADNRRGTPQLLLMKFFSIREEVEQLHRYR